MMGSLMSRNQCFDAPFFFLGRSLNATMCNGSSVAISPVLATTATERGPTSRNSGCQTGYSLPSDVRKANGLNPPLSRSRIACKFMLNNYEYVLDKSITRELTK